MTIHLDSTKGLESNRRGYTHILAIVDAFTGYLTLFLLKEVTTKVMAQCIFKYVTIHSIPVKIVTDRGSEFQKELLADLMKIWSIHHSKVSSYNHKENGKVEVSHKIVKNMMRTLIKKYEKDWDLLLPMVEFAYNTQKHSVTGYKPFTLQFGRPPTFPIDITLKTKNPDFMTLEDYVVFVRDKMREIFDLVNKKR